MNENPVFRGLNPEQRQAVESLQGPMLVLAGAGSGKTRVITHRIAWGLASGAFRPEQVLAVTFTNKAAGEMRSRIAALTGRDFSSLWIRTFHSACAALLRLEAGRLDYPRGFSIYDAADQLAVVKRILKTHFTLGERHTPQAFVNAISRAKDNLQLPGDFDPDDTTNPFHQALHTVYREYERELAAARAFDFGDLIFRAVRLLTEHQDLLDKWRTMFPYLLVDEFQDTNRAQYRLIRLLAGTTGNVCVVGDDDQSIYSWRGADIGNILSFKEDFPDCGIIRLEQNYRSTPQILAIASGVISHNSNRMEKTLWSNLPAGTPATCSAFADDREEARGVGAAVESLLDLGLLPAAIAVFYRTNAQSRSLEDEFVRRRIAYRVVGGIRFYERKEVKDLLAYLRLAVNGHDHQAFLRAVAVPPRGIGPKTAALIREEGATGEDLVQSIRGLLDSKALKGKKTRAGLEAFHACILKIRAVTDPVASVETALTASGLAAHYADEEDRLEDLQELVNAARRAREEFPEEGLEEFLNRAALLGEGDRNDDGAAIQLMTIHNAKGLEFDTVFITGMEEGLFPHFLSCEEAEKMEEERRLFYVGVTRAKKTLCLSAARRRLAFGRTVFNGPSRFLEEIPPELCRFVEDGFTVTAIPPADNPLPPSPQRIAPGFRPGDRVRHPEYGEGIITRRTGTGSLAQIQVAFGEKSCLFLERYSNLTALADDAGGDGG